MSRVAQTRSAIALMLALGLVSPAAFAADGAEASSDSGKASASKESADKSKAATQEEQPSDSTMGEYQMGGKPSFFGSDSSGTGFTQQAASAGYELSGSGITGGRGGSEQGLLMTSPSRGRALGLTEGIYVFPSAMIGFGYNDNVTAVSSGKKSSSIVVFSPEVVAEVKNRGDRYTASYVGNYGRYQSSSADDFDNHAFWLGADNYFTTRFRTGVGAGYIVRSDARGTTSVNSSILPEPSRWHAPVMRGLAIYGAKGAPGRLEFEASYMNKRYENNRATTESYDVDIASFTGRFFYRVMPKTYALMELRDTESDYKLSTALNDNSDRRVYLGVTWEATAKTEGTIKLGKAYKTFNNSTLKDASGNAWEIGLRWLPMTYSMVELETSKSLYDSMGVGSYVTGTATTLSWDHKWASYINSRLSVGKLAANYQDAGRKDDTKTFSAALYRELGRHVRAGMSYTYTDRKSTSDGFDFKRNAVMLTFEGVF
ncbi:outer membrane beta-barrel protein [Quatrionicoccus australiensis]|uniref:outer membrane beta-barrel protein n=1 Tax=Quatrionicoccus australiensis TaxID=138118 RepID=UPI001CFA24F3|nr:outer membrane beta-barrel protein [Quatrionicoccus australiensis]MCB4358680.1 outer membrane beta-barrel protein [Quatrionicoccus australiensis]